MFQIPNLDPKADSNRFHFQVPRRHWWQFRRSYSIPYLHFIPLQVMREARKADAPLQLHEIASRIGEPAAAKAILRLNQPEIALLEKQWLNGSVVGLGELGASSA